MAYANPNNMMAKLMMQGGGNAIAGLNQIKRQNQMAQMINQQNLANSQQTNQFNAAMNPMKIAQAKRGKLQQGNDGQWYFVKPDGTIEKAGAQQPGAQAQISPQLASGRGIPGGTPFNPAAMEIFGGSGQPPQQVKPPMPQMATPGYAGPVQQPQGQPIPQQAPQSGFNVAKQPSAGELAAIGYLSPEKQAAYMQGTPQVRGPLYTEAKMAEREAIKTGKRAHAYSAKSDFLPGGVARLIDPQGNVTLKKDGIEITDPAERNRILAESRQVEATQRGLIAGTEARSKQSVQFAGDFYKRIEPINKGIANMEEAKRLLATGADTGPITSMFPSFKAATVELENINNQMGLDVIGTTTFGALSESELKFALDTALPVGLPPAELADWLERKISAQGKLRDYMGEAAMYLGKPGNTLSSWIKVSKQRQKLRDMTPEELEARRQELNG